MTQFGTSFLDQARNGHQKPWKKIVKVLGPLVREQCRNKGISPTTADDICQNVFVTLWKGLDTFSPDGEPNAFLRWVRTTARRRISDYYRSVKDPQGVGGTDAVQMLQAEEDPIADEAEWPMDEMARATYERVLLIVSQSISETDWLIFRLRNEQELSPAETAEQVGKTRRAVNTSVWRTRRKIAEAFGDILE